MNAKENIHALAFLEEMFPSQKTRFESEWLTSDFDSNVWCFDFARGYRFCVNFNVELEDGSKLSAPKNKKPPPPKNPRGGGGGGLTAIV